MTVITINLPDSVNLGTMVNGTWLPLACDGVANSWWVKFIAKGVQREVNDRNGGEAPQVKLDAARLLMDAINAGEEFVGRSRGGAATMSALERLALSIAKTELKRRFAKRPLVVACGKVSIAPMCQADTAVAEYFEGVVWKDDMVKAWIAKAVDFKVSFDAVAKAQKAMDEIAALDVSVDTDEI